MLGHFAWDELERKVKSALLRFWRRAGGELERTLKSDTLHFWLGRDELERELKGDGCTSERYFRVFLSSGSWFIKDGFNSA